MQIKTTVRHHITPIRMTIFIVEKTYNMQCILLTFFFSVQYCIVNYIYIAVQQIFRNFSSCVTETPYPLNRNSLFPPHPNPWKPPLYVLLPTSIFFFFFWLCWVFVVDFSLVVVSRDYSSLWCTDFSLQWLLLLWSTVSRHTGFCSCGTWAQQLWHAGSRVQAQQFW